MRLDLLITISGGETGSPVLQGLLMIRSFLELLSTVITGSSTKPTDLQNLAPSANPPFMTFDGKVKTDVNKIEEFLEEKLAPPRYPELGTQHPESNSARNDVFAKFSAFIKNTKKDANESVSVFSMDLHSASGVASYKMWGILTHCTVGSEKAMADHSSILAWQIPWTEEPVYERNLLKALKKLDSYLNRPLPDKIDAYSTEEAAVSGGKFLDGNELTLADCNLLPKLHIIKIVAKRYKDFEFPSEMTGIWSTSSAYNFYAAPLPSLTGLTEPIVPEEPPPKDSLTSEPMFPFCIGGSQVA
ncbi:hypothetical protein MG293_000098 [Ovis ammon polii]|uniref:CLIC N-terminal domain-containing protein n=1 Tax=Ovis ammon polii TaxID=230172 RepID=A0AAD4YH55_OVIAM|nr:hypothetical protein MG293_000098 [Ovis ammon polii]